MKDLYELKEKVYDELKNYSKKDLTASTLNTVKDLTKTAYYLCELIEEEEEGYSNRGSYESRGSYENRARGGGSRAGGSRARRRNSYEGNSYERNSYNDGYSYGGEMVEELKYLMQDAPDERTKQEFMRFIQKIEGM